MKKPNSFKPTPAQIAAAEDLTIAMALDQVVAPVFAELETQVLAEGVYLSEAGDQITDARLTYRLKGISDYDTNKYPGSEADRFFTALKRAANAKGFLEGENTGSIVNHNVTKFENAFIDATEAIHKIQRDKLYMLDHRKKLIDLTLSLIVPFIDGKGLENKKREYFKKYLVDM